MAKDGIVLYNSFTGYTKRYAEYLAETLDYAIKPIQKANLFNVSTYPTIIFGGPLHHNRIEGISGIIDGCSQAMVFYRIILPISKPGIVKGNHWHHTKNEKFLVVKGQGLIRLRRIDSQEVLEYPVSGDKLEVVDIPVGYTHSIENVGSEDMITVMWANEAFDPDHPDTYFLKV